MPLIRGPNAAPSAINWQHPATRGLQLLAVNNGAPRMIDLLRREIASAPGATSPGYLGHSANYISSGSSFTNRSTALPTNYTMAALVKVNAVGSAQGILSTNTATGAGIELGTSATNFPLMRAGNGTVTTGTLAVVAAGMYFIGASHAQIGASSTSAIVTRRLDGSGAFNIVIGVGNQTASAGTATWEISKATRIFNGEVTFGLISFGYVSPRELIAWAQDPWGIFASARQSAIFTSLAASSSTVALSSTSSIKSAGRAAASASAAIVASASIKSLGKARSSAATAISAKSAIKVAGASTASPTTAIKATASIKSSAKASPSLATPLKATASIKSSGRAAPSLTVALKGASSIAVHGSAALVGSIALAAKASLRVTAKALPLFGVALSGLSSIRATGTASPGGTIALAATSFIRVVGRAVMHISGGFSIIQKPRMVGTQIVAKLLGTKSTPSLSGTKTDSDLDGEIDQ